MSSSCPICTEFSINEFPNTSESFNVGDLADKTIGTTSEFSLYLGLECGGTRTTAVVLNTATGKPVFELTMEAPSNAQLVGVSGIISLCKIAISEFRSRQCSFYPFEGVGITGAGLEPGMAIAQELCERLAQLEEENGARVFPENSIAVMNDSIGAGFCLGAGGGLVLIAGTGSMGRVVTEKTPIQTEKGVEGDVSSEVRCGGWGHILGDEGSGYWLSHRAVQLVWQHDDGLPVTDHDVSALRKAIWKRYELTDDRNSIMDVWCRTESFSKSRCAALAVDISRLAAEGDALALQLMNECGNWLGTITATILRRSRAFGLGPSFTLLAVGSCWKSFDLFRSAFEEGLRPVLQENEEIRILSMRRSAAAGAAWRAALLRQSSPLLEFNSLTQLLYTVKHT